MTRNYSRNDSNYMAFPLNGTINASHTMFRLMFSGAPFETYPTYIVPQANLFGEANGIRNGTCTDPLNCSNCTDTDASKCKTCKELGICTNSSVVDQNFITQNGNTIAGVFRCNSPGVNSTNCLRMGMQSVKPNAGAGAETKVYTGGFSLTNMTFKSSFKANSLYPSEKILDFLICFKSAL